MVDFKSLAAPFPPEEVSWRLGSTSKEKMRGMALAYLDARNVMDRLDDVCGPAGWQCRYSHANGKTVCDIAVKCDDEWVWKADGAGDSDIEAEKGSLSDAFKRAAVRWGIGRYLYHIDSPWVEIEEAGRSFRIKKGEYRNLDMVLRRANQAIVNPPPAGHASSSLSLVKNDIAQMQNAGTQPTPEPKTAGRLNAELWASQAVTLFRQSGFDLLGYREWKETPCTPKGTKNNGEKLEEIREKHPDLADEIDKVVDTLRPAVVGV